MKIKIKKTSGYEETLTDVTELAAPTTALYQWVFWTEPDDEGEQQVHFFNAVYIEKVLMTAKKEEKDEKQLAEVVQFPKGGENDRTIS